MSAPVEKLKDILKQSALTQIPPTVANASRHDSWTGTPRRIVMSEGYQTPKMYCRNSPKPLVRLIAGEESEVLIKDEERSG